MDPKKIEFLENLLSHVELYSRIDFPTSLRACIDEIKRLNEMIDKFWKAVHLSYDIESREFFEEQAPKIGKNWTPMEMALHHMWKRDPKNDAYLEIIKKCAETFREYEKIHQAKLPKDEDVIPAIYPSPYAGVEEKVKRNRVMAEMCERVLV